MSTINQTIDSILEKSNEISKEEAIKEVTLLIALSKRDKYEIITRKEYFDRFYDTNKTGIPKHKLPLLEDGK